MHLFNFGCVLYVVVFSRADRHTKQKKKRKWVCQRLVCQKRELAARLSSSVKFQDVKF